MLFHVTNSENVRSIWDNGIRSSEIDADWKEERQAMRQKLDDRGKSENNNWVNREGSIFFWTKYSDAVEYAKATGLDAIVEIDANAVESRFWAVNNQVVEELFEVVSYEFGSGVNLDDSEEVDALIDEFFSYAYEWDGEYDSGYEVWTQPPIESKAITQITDLQGEPFDL